MGSNVPGALLADLSACNEYTNGMDAAAAITCPTITILSGQDKMTPIKTGRALNAVLGGELHEIPHAGHMSITEQPFDVNLPLRAFIEKHA